MSARIARRAVALSTAFVAAAVGAAQAQLNSAQQDQVGQPQEQQSQAPAYQTQQSQAPRDAAMLPPVVVTATGRPLDSTRFAGTLQVIPQERIAKIGRAHV